VRQRALPLDLPVVDVLLALGFLVAGELEVARVSGLENPVWADGIAVAVLMTSLAWRRRFPLVVCVVAGLSITVLAVHGDVRSLNVPMVALVVPPYSAGRHEPRGRALAGFGICLWAPLVAALPQLAVGDLGFSVGMVAASWTTGRAIRANNLRAHALRRRAARAVAARDDMQRLVLVAERSRIARELQAVVVSSVSEMVLAAETAGRLLDTVPEESYRMMASVEVTAQQVLADVRRLLGMLRDGDDAVGLAPLPGIGHLEGLRGAHERPVRLTVEGIPRAMPPSVDLGVYRIAESAFESALADPSSEPLDVRLSYAPGRVRVGLSVGGRVCSAWPTASMREWADLCEAQLTAEEEGPDERLTLSIPVPAEEHV
jgi:signal transduction histidine kinase